MFCRKFLIPFVAVYEEESLPVLCGKVCCSGKHDIMLLPPARTKSCEPFHRDPVNCAIPIVMLYYFQLRACVGGK